MAEGCGHFPGCLQSEFRWQQDAQEVFAGRGKQSFRLAALGVCCQAEGFPFMYAISRTNLSSKRMSFCLGDAVDPKFELSAE